MQVISPQRYTRFPLKRCIVVLFTLMNGFIVAQQGTEPTLVFNFNDHTFNELHHKVNTAPTGVYLTEDRFGNKESALYLEGHTNSYFSLGSSELLKPKAGTLALWVKLDRRVYAGKGYEGNPILIARRCNDVDFYDAYTIFYDFKSDRLMTFFSKDSTEQTGLNSKGKFEFGEWYHLAVTFDSRRIAFYINGELQGVADKNFETTYLKDSPVYVGQGNSTKNDRRTRGTVDDIYIFHRVLSANEIKELYNEPNPNRSRIIFYIILKIAGVIAGTGLLAFLLVWQRRKNLKREQEKYELYNRLHEMEIRTLKAQMNPHFIFNSMNAIQQFIMKNENEKAQEYLAKLSKLIRQLLETNANESLTVSEEVDILERYVEMESLRFNEVFNCEIEVDKKINQDETRIPHLLVQPFVENAIWHGLLPKEGEKKLKILFCFEDENRIKCVVDDNGIGRKASAHKDETFKKKSLAMSLVRQRLELMSKTLHIHCNVEIKDKLNDENKSTGTMVTVLLPVLKNNTHEKSGNN